MSHHRPLFGWHPRAKPVGLVWIGPLSVSCSATVGPDHPRAWRRPGLTFIKTAPVGGFLAFHYNRPTRTTP